MFCSHGLNGFQGLKSIFKLTCHGRSQPKSWGRVELDKFEFTSLKLGHYEKKVEIYVLYERIFVRHFPKIDLFRRKLAKNGIFCGFSVAPKGATNFLGF